MPVFGRILAVGRQSKSLDRPSLTLKLTRYPGTWVFDLRMTKQLATRVREDFHDELKIFAATHRLKLVEVLEQGHEALKATKKYSS